MIFTVLTVFTLPKSTCNHSSSFNSACHLVVPSPSIALAAGSFSVDAVAVDPILKLSLLCTTSPLILITADAYAELIQLSLTAIALIVVSLETKILSVYNFDFVVGTVPSVV